MNRVLGSIGANIPSICLWIIAAIPSTLLVEFLSILFRRLASKGEVDDFTREGVHKKKSFWSNLPTLGESLEKFFKQLVDSLCALFLCIVAGLFPGFPYSSRKNKGKLYPTQRDSIKQINHISKTVSEYKKYRDEVIEQGADSTKGAWMFGQSKQIPLVIQLDAVQDEKGMEEILVRLTRIEELTGKTFGIAYRSPHHIMIVDPVIKMPKKPEKDREVDLQEMIKEEKSEEKDNLIYAYERLVATKNGIGIVAVPIHRDENGNEKFVLIRQFRHAIRREQWNFPRGFGENGLSALKNTQKELYEEICAVLWDPEKQSEIRYNKEDPESSDDPTSALVELGRITTDSGSQCDTVAIVQAEVKSHAVPENHEAIIDSKEVDAEELRNMIMSHQIDDSFTIMAFTLWSYRNGYDQNVVK